MKRIIKQLIIVIAVLLVITGVVLGVRWLTKVNATCFDGLQNGSEDGVDCGGNCKKSCPPKKPDAKPVEVKKFQILQGENKCDLVAVVDNPNTVLGAQHIPYSIKWGTFEKKGEFYVYPSEERYVAEMNLPCQDSTASPTIEVGNPLEWEFFSGYEKPRLDIPDPKYRTLDSPYEFAEIIGDVFNKSPFDLKEIEVYAAITDDDTGDIITINKTTVNEILVGEKREFRLFWTHPFPQNKGTIHFYTTSNLFNTQNFVKKYGVQSTKWNETNTNSSDSNTGGGDGTKGFGE